MRRPLTGVLPHNAAGYNGLAVQSSGESLDVTSPKVMAKPGAGWLVPVTTKKED